MTDDEQPPRPSSALQLAAQGVRRRPRRDPADGMPRIDEADLPDPEELAHVRAQLARSCRPNKFIRQ